MLNYQYTLFIKSGSFFEIFLVITTKVEVFYFFLGGAFLYIKTPKQMIMGVSTCIVCLVLVKSISSKIVTNRKDVSKQNEQSAKYNCQTFINLFLNVS